MKARRRGSNCFVGNLRRKWRKGEVKEEADEESQGGAIAYEAAETAEEPESSDHEGTAAGNALLAGCRD